MKRKIWHIFSIVFWTTYGIIVCLKIAIGFLSLETFPLPVRSYVVQTASMSPYIHPGDMIFVKSALPDDLRVKDIITFHDLRGHVITHRITQTIFEKNTWQFVTKGDNNNAEDENFVREDQIIGTYIGGIPKLGYVLVATGKPSGIFLMIAIPLILVIFEDRSKKQIKKSELQLT